MTGAYAWWAGFVIVQLLVGYAFVRRGLPPGLAWTFPLVSIVVAHFLLLNSSPVIRMLGLIIPLLHAMKIVVASRHPRGRLNFGNWVLYYIASVGMNPSIFAERTAPVLDWRMLGKAVGHMALGTVLLIGLSAKLGASAPNSTAGYWAVSLVALVALSLVLHFGILPLSTFALRAVGVPDYPAFVQPFRAKSLSEFWSRRWNVPFSEMTAVAVFKPLIRRVGVGWAGFLSFMVSGLLHEVAISLSVLEGFGLPMLYFLIHGGLMGLEKRLFGKDALGTWWVLLCLLLPLPLLFHRWFLERVIWSLL